MILLLACSGGEAGPGVDGLLVEDFVGPEAFRMEFVEAGSMSAEDGDTGGTGGTGDTGEEEANDVLHLHADAGIWSFRFGQRWSEATPMGEYAVETGDDGFTMAGDQVLPPRLKVGETSDMGVEVIALGELEVWYGTFPMVASVEVTEGVAGAHAFAEGIGPIRLAIFGDEWELAFYE